MMNPLAFISIIVFITISFMVLVKIFSAEDVPYVGERTTGCSWGDCSVWEYTAVGWELCARHAPRDLPLNYIACQKRMGVDE